MYCCVRGCLSRYGKDIVSFHKFPKKNPARMELWVQAVGRASEIDYDKSWVCGRHFVGGKAARPSENEEDNWVPTLLLGGAGGGRHRQHPTTVTLDDDDDDDEPTHFEDDFNVRCTVRGCQNTREENPSMLFFPIPTREPTRTIWLQRMGLQSAPVGGRGRPTPGVCELHFELTKDLQNYDEFITTGAAGVLKEGVILSRNIPVALDQSQDASEVTTLDDDDSLLEELVPDKSRNGDESMPDFPDHMQPSPIEEFVQVCRSCLSTDKTNLVTGLDDQLAEIFRQFTSISISKSEGISTSFCQECRNRLLELHFFRDTCLTSTQILIHRYQKCYGITPDSDQEDGDRSSFGNGSFASSSRHQNNTTADDPEDLLMAQEEEPTDSYWGHRGQSSGIKRRGRPPKHEMERTAKRMKQNHLKKRHSCKVCHKEYNSRAGIDMHMATHKDDDPAEFTVTCSKCPVLRRPGDKHTCYVNTVVCHVCSEPFNGWSYLKLHLGKVHKIKTKRHELMEKLKERKADQLLKSPIKRFDISALGGRPSSSSSITPKTTGKDAPEPYLKCNFCKAVYKHKPTLDAHLRTHAANELKECNECGEEFPNFRSLQKHHDEHTDHGTDEKSGLVNMCHLCGMQMNRRQTLLLHRQYVHRDSEVVKCDSCPRLFASAKRRAEHHCPAMGRKRHDSASNGATSASASGRDSAASSSGGGGINGDFVIVKPESILKGTPAFALDGDDDDDDDDDGRVDPMATTHQGDNADPLLGLGNEDVIELESDEEEDEEDEDSNQTGKSTTFECTVCNKVFEKEDVLERHMKLHRMMSAAKSNSSGLRK